MKRLINILIIGLIVSLPFSAIAQDKKETDKVNISNGNQTIVVQPRLDQRNSQEQSNTELEKGIENLENKDGLYHIVISTKGSKSESIWIELEDGEQKVVTIMLNNGSKKSVSIQLEDANRRTLKFDTYNKLSQLTLQPISF